MCEFTGHRITQTGTQCPLSPGAPRRRAHTVRKTGLLWKTLLPLGCPLGAIRGTTQTWREKEAQLKGTGGGALGAHRAHPGKGPALTPYKPASDRKHHGHGLPEQTHGCTPVRGECSAPAGTQTPGVHSAGRISVQGLKWSDLLQERCYGSRRPGCRADRRTDEQTDRDRTEIKTMGAQV